MENQPKLNSSKEVIAFLAERFPHCFSAEGEARPLKIGIFQDLVDRVAGEMNLSKTQLRSALRLYTSSWRYLYGVKPGATRVDLDGNPCGELDEQHVEHARKQLEEAKARVQAQRAEQQAKKREAAAAAGEKEDAPRRERKPRPTTPRRKEGAERKPRAQKPVEKAPKTAKAPREEQHTPVSDISALTVGQALKVKAGQNAMDATVLEITKDGVRVQLNSGMSLIVRAEHRCSETEAGPGMNMFFRLTALAGLLAIAGQTFAVEDITRADQIPVLKEETQHATVSERVTSRFTRSHYRQFDLDQAFSAKIFDRYLNLLDYSHNVLLASDVEQFAKKKTELGDELRSGKLDVFYDLYNLAQKRRFERYQYALSVLEKPMDFTGNDTYNLDRSKAPWPKNEAELNALWDSKVKFDELSLKLAGKTDKEIRETLTRRYKFAIRRLAQTNSEDVFSLAMTAFAREIDPHTNYLSPRNTEQFNTEMSLSLEGIGAVLQMDDDYTVINSMVAGGPAAKSKAISVGDKIVGVGQTGKPMVDVIGWRLDDVVALIKGPKGSKVRLEILPAGKGTKTRTVTLTRERIRLEDRAVKMSVKTVGKEKVGVLDIPGFYVGLTDDVKVQLQKLEKQNVSSVIIDLRSNGGGALTEAVSLSGLFIPAGPIVQVRDNNGKVREDSDTDGQVFYKGPLVVLVDRFSASASEIFAAAMQDYGRALVVGEPTFGKGTVQQYRSLNRIYDQMLRPEWPALGSVQYTIQKFYRVNGGSTQRKGVTPDIIMPTGNEETETGEKFEDNALPWDSIDAATYVKSGDLTAFEPELLKEHNARIAKDPEFQNIMKDIARFNAMKDKRNIVSLNYAVREKENNEDDATRLARLNERFKREGKPELKKLDDLPKDYQEPDPYLDETVNIALDLAKLEKARPAEQPAPVK